MSNEVQLIKQEIERLKNHTLNIQKSAGGFVTSVGRGRVEAFNDILKFIDSLPETKKTGVELIADERQRQIEKEGWTAEHDAEHICGELTDAAVMYAMRGYWKKRIDPMIVGTEDIPGIMWPFRWDGFKLSTAEWPDGRIRDLVKAGALIAAEIDRLLNLKK